MFRHSLLTWAHEAGKIGIAAPGGTSCHGSWTDSWTTDLALTSEFSLLEYDPTRATQSGLPGLGPLVQQHPDTPQRQAITTHRFQARDATLSFTVYFDVLGQDVATSYPYVSSQGALVKAFEQFRKQVPATIDAELLKKFSIAPANESYVINILRFLGLIDENGRRIEAATDFFYGDDTKFGAGLEHQIQAAYKPLFDDHGSAVWSESTETLTTWFRVSGKTSDVVGSRQAKTFQTLSALVGHGEASPPSRSKTAQTKRKTGTSDKKPTKATGRARQTETTVEVNNDTNKTADHRSRDVGLTVRIEVNLPANGTAEVYDAIFASVRKHLIDRD